jgi:hypothetical protein
MALTVVMQIIVAELLVKNVVWLPFSSARIGVGVRRFAVDKGSVDVHRICASNTLNDALRLDMC